MQIEEKFLISKRLTSFVNPYSYVQLNKRIHRLRLEDFCLYADGLLVVIFERIVRKKSVRRFSFDFSSIADFVLKDAAARGLKVSFVGGTESEISGFRSFISSAYPELDVDRYQSGYFKSNSDRNELLLELLNMDVVIVGMGTVLQEKFLLELKSLGWVGYGYTCGGFIKQTAEAQGHYYPQFINKLNLRWLYRLVKEPKLLWRRYLLSYPYFVLHYLNNFRKEL